MKQNVKWIVGAVVLLLASGTAVAFALKPGAQLPTTAEMSIALRAVSDVWGRYGYVPTVTSGTDGEHGDDSLHYDGLALDFRTKDLSPRLKQQMIADVRDELGGSYDVVLEFAGSANEHLHIEYDSM